jgi:hypothetical protein
VPGEQAAGPGQVARDERAFDRRTGGEERAQAQRRLEQQPGRDRARRPRQAADAALGEARDDHGRGHPRAERQRAGGQRRAGRTRTPPVAGPGRAEPPAHPPGGVQSRRRLAEQRVRRDGGRERVRAGGHADPRVRSRS